MDVFSFDGKLLGRAIRRHGRLLFEDRSGRRLGLRPEAIYDQAPGRLTLICYEQGLAGWVQSDLGSR